MNNKVAYTIRSQSKLKIASELNFILGPHMYLYSNCAPIWGL